MGTTALNHYPLIFKELVAEEEKQWFGFEPQLRAKIKQYDYSRFLLKLSIAREV